MIHHQNMIAVGEGSIVRDLQVSAAVTKGQAVTHGATTAGGGIIPAAQVPVQVIGVANETQATTNTLTTGTLSFAKTIINPDSIYLAQWETDTAQDVDATAGATTSITVGASDDHLDGSWVYFNSGTGVGQLAFIGEATTTVLTFDTTTALTAGDATTDILIIRRQLGPSDSSGYDLSTGRANLLSDEDCTGEIILLENYIKSSSIAMAPLRPRQHHALSGLNTDNVKFYADIMFKGNFFFGSETMG